MAQGSIIQRGKTYSVKVPYKDPADGKWKSVWRTAPSKRQAERLRTELLAEIDKGGYRKPTKETVADYLQFWLVNYARQRLTPKSYERYESVVRIHIAPSIGGIPLAGLRPEALQALYAAKLDGGLASMSVKYIHTIMHKALAIAVKWEKLPRNVADSVDPPRASRTEMQIWDESEIVRFLRAAQTTPYHPLFALALYSGARRGELLALRWQDMDLERGQMSISRSLHQVGARFVFTEPKTAKSRRMVALPSTATILLRQLRESTEHVHARLGGVVRGSDLIFTASVDGKPLRPNTVSRAWGNLAKLADVKVIRFHDARHSHAALLIKQGIHLKIISERLGHANISVTADTYGHLLPGIQEAAAARFDQAITGAYNEQGVREQVR